MVAYSTQPAIIFIAMLPMILGVSLIAMRALRSVIHREKRGLQTVTEETYNVKGIRWSQMMTETEFQQRYHGNTTPLGTATLPAIKFPMDWFVAPNSVVMLPGRGMRAIQIKCPTRSGNTELVRLVFKLQSGQ